MKQIINFRTQSGSEPFADWLMSINDKVSRAKVRAFIDRVALGGSRKNVEHVGDGVFEFKVDFGPGFRIYFGEQGRELIVLLVGGTKRRQQRDVDLAKEYWREYHAKT